MPGNNLNSSWCRHEPRLGWIRVTDWGLGKRNPRQIGRSLSSRLCLWFSRSTHCALLQHSRPSKFPTLRSSPEPPTSCRTIHLCPHQTWTVTFSKFCNVTVKFTDAWWNDEVNVLTSLPAQRHWNGRFLSNSDAGSFSGGSLLETMIMVPGLT